MIDPFVVDTSATDKPFDVITIFPISFATAFVITLFPFDVIVIFPLAFVIAFDIDKFDVELLHNVATDGFTHHVKDKIDSLSKEEFDVWMRYHLSTCEREDLQGYSNHMLYICRKK